MFGMVHRFPRGSGPTTLETSGRPDLDLKVRKYLASVTFKELNYSEETFFHDVDATSHDQPNSKSPQ